MVAEKEEMEYAWVLIDSGSLSLQFYSQNEDQQHKHELGSCEEQNLRSNLQARRVRNRTEAPDTLERHRLSPSVLLTK